MVIFRERVINKRMIPLSKLNGSTGDAPTGKYPFEETATKAEVTKVSTTIHWLLYSNDHTICARLFARTRISFTRNRYYKFIWGVWLEQRRSHQGKHANSLADTFKWSRNISARFFARTRTYILHTKCILHVYMGNMAWAKAKSQRYARQLYLLILIIFKCLRIYVSTVEIEG